MRRSAVLALLMPFTLLAADPPVDKVKEKDKEKKPALSVNANLPGPFHPYNVNGKFEGRYHCPITEHAEDPMVLVFTRDLAVGDKLKSLLQKLESVTKANKDGARLAAAVVFLDNEKLPDILGKTDETDDRRQDLAASLKEKLAGMFTEKNQFTKQNLVVVCIASDPDLTKYELDLRHNATVVLYHKLEIKAVHDLEDLDDAHIDAIMKDVADKLGATRK